jgi:biopolymer transport protein TolR
MSDINVTPLVDVMLVLLIIFMVTAPLLTVGVPVDLPKTQAEVISDPDEPLVITVNAEGRLFLQETELDVASLAPRLLAITQNKLDSRIFVRGDRTIQYGRVMEVMGALTSAGFTQVALIAELPDPGAAAAPADGGAATNGTAD